MRPPLSRPIHRKQRAPNLNALVVEVLTFLGDDPERLDRFLASSGLSASDLRGAAATSAFAEGLLDHLCSDERLLVRFAGLQGYDPGAIERLRLTLAPPFEP